MGFQTGIISWNHTVDASEILLLESPVEAGCSSFLVSPHDLLRFFLAPSQLVASHARHGIVWIVRGAKI